MIHRNKRQPNGVNYLPIFLIYDRVVVDYSVFLGKKNAIQKSFSIKKQMIPAYVIQQVEFRVNSLLKENEKLDLKFSIMLN